MTNKERVIWLLFACVLAVLFLLSSTDLIIKERKSEIYSIAVIIEDSRDDHYVNFKKGMDQAAIALNADVSFITLYDARSSRQQMDMILREQQDGSGAIVVSPVQEMDLLHMMEQNQIRVPLVVLNSERTDSRIAAAISPDYYAMGQMLGREIIREHPLVCPVFLFCQYEPTGGSELFYSGVNGVFADYGYPTELFLKPGEAGFDRILTANAAPNKGIVVVALDQESLVETAAALSENSILAGLTAGLYGRGNGINMLNYLDRGIISGLCVTDDFSAGYFSVQYAIEAITKKRERGLVTLDSYYIRRGDIRKPEYEKMLYPIE